MIIWSHSHFQFRKVAPSFSPLCLSPFTHASLPHRFWLYLLLTDPKRNPLHILFSLWVNACINHILPMTHHQKGNEMLYHCDRFPIPTHGLPIKETNWRPLRGNEETLRSTRDTKNRNKRQAWEACERNSQMNHLCAAVARCEKRVQWFDCPLTIKSDRTLNSCHSPCFICNHSSFHRIQIRSHLTHRVVNTDPLIILLIEFSNDVSSNSLPDSFDSHWLIVMMIWPSRKN